MTATVLFAANASLWEEYAGLLRDAFRDKGVDASLTTDAAPETVDYIVYSPDSEVQDFSAYTNLKAVLNLWAGVETIVQNPTLNAPLARMVDDEGLTQGMVEYVTGHVLRLHLGMDAHIVNPDHDWMPEAPPLARKRQVTILGLGALGTACAQALAGIGFRPRGWSRTEKSLDDVQTFHGADGLGQALDGAEIVVLLLPATPETESVLNGDRIARLSKGAAVINPGRGTLIDDDALLAALDTGQLSHATLDVFRTEPLPRHHPFWAHDRITVTPHIASATRAPSAARVIAENIRRGEAGEPLLHLVDRDAGY